MVIFVLLSSIGYVKTMGLKDIRQIHIHLSKMELQRG